RGQSEGEDRRWRRSGCREAGSETTASARSRAFDQVRGCGSAILQSARGAVVQREGAGTFMASMKTYVFPLIGKMPVADIQTDDVIRVLDPIWNSKPETAGRVRRRIEWILGWSRVRGYATGDNPAAWRGHLATH